MNGTRRFFYGKNFKKAILPRKRVYRVERGEYMMHKWKQSIVQWCERPQMLLGLVGINLLATVGLGIIVTMTSIRIPKTIDQSTVVTQPNVPETNSQETPVNPGLQTPPIGEEPTSEEPPVATTDQQAVANGKVNINLASATLLQELPGIGPQKAQAIIEYRQQTPFVTIQDIQKVSGIGEKTFAKLEALILVE